jgi:polyphosphate kinase 2 (PPK2 family)
MLRVIALPAPTEREKSQMCAQRYLPHFPAAEEVVIFDLGLLYLKSRR